VCEHERIGCRLSCAVVQRDNGEAPGIIGYSASLGKKKTAIGTLVRIRVRTGTLS